MTSTKDPAPAISSRRIVDALYGRPGAGRGAKSIEAFRKKGIAKPAPFEAPVYAGDDREYVVDLSGFDVVNDPRTQGAALFSGRRRGQRNS